MSSPASDTACARAAVRRARDPDRERDAVFCAVVLRAVFLGPELFRAAGRRRAVFRFAVVPPDDVELL
ncbi:MAG: hypothetical protein ABR576_09010 [Thermoanaerobaculia bacterium]